MRGHANISKWLLSIESNAEWILRITILQFRLFDTLINANFIIAKLDKVSSGNSKSIRSRFNFKFLNELKFDSDLLHGLYASNSHLQQVLVLIWLFNKYGSIASRNGIIVSFLGFNLLLDFTLNHFFSNLELNSWYDCVLVRVGRKLICRFHWCLKLINEYLSDINGSNCMIDTSIDSLWFEVHDGRWCLLVLLVDKEVDHVGVEALTATSANKKGVRTTLGNHLIDWY